MPAHRLGELREILTLQRKTATADALKGRSTTWANVALVFAKVISLNADERMYSSRSAFKVVIRYRVDVAPAEMRFLRPVQALAPAVLMTVVSITRSGSTATVTTAAAHNLASGAIVAIAGAVQSEYNVTLDEEGITVPDGSTTTFTYPVAGTPATPATTLTTLTATQHEILEIAGAPRATTERMFLEVECQERAA